MDRDGYLIVARTVMTDVPEAVGPWPVALMANVSLPLYLAFGLYSNVEALSFFNLPCDGFCEMAEAVIVPRIPMGNRQLSPDVTSMSPLEFSPQFASVTDIEHSEGAGAGDAGMTLAASMTSATEASFGNRVVDILILMQNSLKQGLGGGNSSYVNPAGSPREILQRGCTGGKSFSRRAGHLPRATTLQTVRVSCAVIEVASCCPDEASP
ncbi:hypothetical protein [Bradyrhizobium sp. ORS 111]|uniref:hypothetical protein n=1 Tax=Bradyrhizobium sp. ORS 111 TaxID=1685958 RepID=UPI0038909137